MKQFGALMAILACLGSTPGALAEEPIVVDEANPPYTYGKDGKAAGIYPSLIRAAFERMGEKVTVTPLPWRRAISMIDQSNAGIAGLYNNPERAKRYDFSEPVIIETVYLYTATDASFTFLSLDDLAGRTLGVALGWSYGADFDAARANGVFKVEENMTDELNFAKLAAHRLDAVLAPELSGDLVMAKLNLHGRVIRLPNVLVSQPTYLAFNKSAGKRALLDRFNKALAGLRSDGTFDRLVAAALAE